MRAGSDRGRLADRKRTLAGLLFQFVRGVVEILCHAPEHRLVALGRDVLGQAPAALGLTPQAGRFVVHIWLTTRAPFFIRGAEASRSGVERGAHGVAVLAADGEALAVVELQHRRREAAAEN